MIKVYVAGKYSDDNVLDVLRNIGRGERLSAKLFLMGFAPFCPWHDKDFIIKNPDAEFTVQQFYDYSIEWLKVSDCMLLVKGYKTSKGTLKEIEIAEKLGIPVFETIDELKDNYNTASIFTRDVKAQKYIDELEKQNKELVKVLEEVLEYDKYKEDQFIRFIKNRVYEAVESHKVKPIDEVLNENIK